MLGNEINCATPDKERAVQEPARVLRQAIGYCESSLTALEGRLSPVLSPPPPVGEGQQASQPVGCPLSGEIRDSAHEVDSLGRRIAALLSRLEI